MVGLTLELLGAQIEPEKLISHYQYIAEDQSESKW
jgi:hypothetical protein